MSVILQTPRASGGLCPPGPPTPTLCGPQTPRLLTPPPNHKSRIHPCEYDIFHPKKRWSILRRVWRYQNGNQNRKSKKDRQHNGQKKKYKRTNNDLQNFTHKTKDRVTQTSLKTGDEFRCSVRESSSCCTSGTHHVNLKLVHKINFLFVRLATSYQFLG